MAATSLPLSRDSRQPTNVSQHSPSCLEHHSWRKTPEKHHRTEGCCSLGGSRHSSVE